MNDIVRNNTLCFLKLESINKQLKATKDEIQGLRNDNADKRKEIHRLEMELEALKGKVRSNSIFNNLSLSAWNALRILLACKYSDRNML